MQFNYLVVGVFFASVFDNNVVVNAGASCEGKEEVLTKLDFYDATLVNNTLHYPDQSGRLRYEGVGLLKGQSIDLVVTQNKDAPPYSTDMPWRNGYNFGDDLENPVETWNKFGNINVMTKDPRNSSVSDEDKALMNGEGTFDFCFYYTGTENKATVDSFDWSVYDLDFRQSGGLNEKFTIDTSQATFFHVQGDSEVKMWCENEGPDKAVTAEKFEYLADEGVEGKEELRQNVQGYKPITCDPGVRTIFHSTTKGGLEDNPTDPLELTYQQKSRSIEFRFENTSCWTFKYEHYCPCGNYCEEPGGGPAEFCKGKGNGDPTQKDGKRWCPLSNKDQDTYDPNFPNACKRYTSGNFLFAGSSDAKITEEGECVTQSPTAAPDTVSPTASPTKNPTVPPTEAPTKTLTSHPTESLMPTDCTEPAPPKVVESVCMTTNGEQMDFIPMPENAIVVSSQDTGNSLGLTVTQAWKDLAGLAVRSGFDQCIVKGNLTLGSTEDIEGECLDGYANFVVAVYLDDYFDPDDCEACNVDDLSELGGNYKFCAYLIEVPCEPVSVECGVPTLEPSTAPTKAPTTSPTSSPTDSPSKGSTTSPTNAQTNAPTSAPTSDPTKSMMPTDCIELAQPKVVESVCMTTNGEPMDLIPMPENAIILSSQDVDNSLGLTVTQAWKDLAGLAVRSGLDQCIVKGNLTLGSTEDIEGECLDGYANFVVAVYLDDYFDPDDCEACNVDDLAELGGNYEFCAYRIEVSCEPVSVECGVPTSEPSVAPTKVPTTSPTPSPTDSPSKGPTTSPTNAQTNAPTSALTSDPTKSMMPTDCTELAPPKVVESVCMTTNGEPMDLIPMPENAIAIGSKDTGNNLGLTVTQAWKDLAGLAVRSGLDHCIVEGNLTLGSTEDIEGECIDGYANFVVAVYLDDYFDPDDCEACNVDDLAELGGNYEFCAYLIEVPCEPVSVECGVQTLEPSTAPTNAPTVSPTKFPTPSPTVSPTLSPTYSPTKSPTASPTKSPTASPTTLPTKAPTGEPSLSPTVKITQPPIDTNGGDDDDDDDLIFEPTCPEDLELVHHKGQKDIDLDRVVKIVSQDTSTVKVSLNQGWDQLGDEDIPIDHIYYAYRPDTFDEKCYEETSVVEGTVFDTVTIQCNVYKPYALLEICLVDDLENELLTVEDDATVPKCCHPTFPPETPTVCYTIRINCVTECVEEDDDNDNAVRLGLRGSY